MSTIVHLLGSVSSSHSHILTLATHRVKQKCCKCNKTRFASNSPRFFEILASIVGDSSIDYGVEMMQTHNAAPGNPSSAQNRKLHLCRKSFVDPDPLTVNQQPGSHPQ